MSRDVFISRPGEGESFFNPDGCRVTIRVDGRQTAGRFTVVEAEHLPEAPPAPLHVHGNEDEAIQILEGCLIVEIDGVKHEASVGTFIHIPQGVSQRFWNPGSETCRYLSIFSPSGQEDYFKAAYSLDPAQLGYGRELALIRAQYGLEYPRSVSE
ncbi:cupin domain-containing protein [Sphingobium boeckii]|uniref:Mannose-6-phosphate isomerase-like protein (Cupin superfamily) n=1 Tax=Sphingobium boeckii TaxID=1082345 RepID=A0A7W9AIZ7_9SPHN|nr:cupin domain-containing protein [Sphingobium boeckii]MBB5686341.1 mannose-6-phosphate isomerase-like protein (cupin superfamily) [Sphingobium boeckii]